MPNKPVRTDPLILTFLKISNPESSNSHVRKGYFSVTLPSLSTFVQLINVVYNCICMCVTLAAFHGELPSWEGIYKEAGRERKGSGTSR